jgi:hypothetical protein
VINGFRLQAPYSIYDITGLQVQKGVIKEYHTEISVQPNIYIVDIEGEKIKIIVKG